MSNLAGALMFFGIVIIVGLVAYFALMHEKPKEVKQDQPEEPEEPVEQEAIEEQEPSEIQTNFTLVAEIVTEKTKFDQFKEIVDNYSDKHDFAAIGVYKGIVTKDVTIAVVMNDSYDEVVDWNVRNYILSHSELLSDFEAIEFDFFIERGDEKVKTYRYERE